MDSRLNTKRILIFLAFAFGIPWASALVLYLTVKADDLVRVLNLANYVVVLPIPALAAVATRLITREGWGHLWLRPNFRRGWRFYLAAWLLPLLAGIVGAAIFYLLFPQYFDSNLSEVQKLFAGSAFAAVDNPWPLLLVLAVQSMILGVPPGAVISIGEEFGWRAYLLPKLTERFAGAQETARASGLGAGARKAALLIGVIWGVWHWPFFFISIKYTPEMSIVYPLVYLVSTCSLSVLMSWVTLRSGSVWPAAVVHGALRPCGTLVALYTLQGAPSRLLGPTVDGLIGGLGYVALTLVLLFSRRAFAGEQEAGSERVPAVVAPSPG